MSSKQTIRKHNPMARELSSPKYRQRIVKAEKQKRISYLRKHSTLNQIMKDYR